MCSLREVGTALSDGRPIHVLSKRVPADETQIDDIVGMWCAGVPRTTEPRLVWSTPQHDLAISGRTKKLKCIYSGLWVKSIRLYIRPYKHVKYWEISFRNKGITSSLAHATVSAIGEWNSLSPVLAVHQVQLPVGILFLIFVVIINIPFNSGSKAHETCKTCLC